jgi:type III secretion system YscQ/HrcQ family protein
MSITQAKTIPLGGSPTLISVTPGQAYATCELYGRSLHMALTDDLQMSVRFDEVRVAEVDLQLRVRCEGHIFDLQFVHADALADVQLALSLQVPEGLRRAAILAAAHDLWRALEGWLGCTVELVSALARQPAWPAIQALGMDIQVKPSRVEPETRCRVMLKTAHLESWRAFCEATLLRLQPSVAQADAYFNATVLCDSLPVTVNQLHDLQTGDVLLLQAPLNRRLGLPVFLAAGGARLPGVQGLWHENLFRVASTNTTLSLKDTFRSHTMNPLDSTKPSHTDGTASAQIDAAFDDPDQIRQGNQGLGDLMMSIQVEVARLSLPLSALQNLTVGQIFDTEQPIGGASVVLWCAGQRLGEGQLVAIGERLGVRLMSMPGESHARRSSATKAESVSTID